MGKSSYKAVVDAAIKLCKSSETNECTYAEIADRCGVSVRTVDRHLSCHEGFDVGVAIGCDGSYGMLRMEDWIVSPA